MDLDRTDRPRAALAVPCRAAAGRGPHLCRNRAREDIVIIAPEGIRREEADSRRNGYYFRFRRNALEVARESVGCPGYVARGRSRRCSLRARAPKPMEFVSEGENGSTREYRSQPGTQQAGASQVKFSQSCHRSYTGHTGITECLIPDIPEVWRCLPLRHQRWVGTPVRLHLTPGHVRTMGAAQLRWRGWGLPTPPHEREADLKRSDQLRSRGSVLRSTGSCRSKASPSFLRLLAGAAVDLRRTHLSHQSVHL